ncbi:unnamed protein product [Rhizophagus irregularis]|uniref:Uncharacterized protein n=1 Tax=Rhizophagus irregularis TaxID=588596 RepID=A0A915ZKZ4_9GLOM|nr:unnamed protein product [Rhizophagus irregularis]CAB5380579.1 unnamed protein product [Rhizophagus irregularis]
MFGRVKSSAYSVLGIFFRRIPFEIRLVESPSRFTYSLPSSLGVVNGVTLESRLKFEDSKETIKNSLF